MPLTRQGNIDSLTGFRFVAAMLVFVSHYAIPGITGIPLRMTMAGYAGVTLFFVLSGFVIAYTYLDRFEAGMTGQNVGAYLAARFARLYPLYILFILFGWLVTGSPDIPWAHILAVQTWSANGDFATSINGPAWSIGVEVFLYLAFPLVLPVLIRLQVFSSLRHLVAAAALVSLAMLAAASYFALSGQNDLHYNDPLSSHRWLYRTPALRLGDFLLGIFGAVYVMRFAKADPATIRRWGLATLCAAILMLLFLATRKNYRSAFSWDVAYAIPGVLMIVGLAMNPGTLISRVLASPAFVLLGEASYAFYLVHVPARPLLAGTPAGLANNLALYIMFVGMVIALSVGLHMTVERPARRWLRAWLTPRPRAAVQRDLEPARPETS